VENDFFTNLDSCTAYGQVLSDGRVIDLVAPADAKTLEIIIWDRQQTIVVPKLEHEGMVYRPPKLHPSIRAALRFPTAAADYESTLALVSKLTELCTRYFGLSERCDRITAVWILTTWIQDACYCPPALCIAGCSMPEVMRFFRFLRAVCRRAITVADLSLGLPMELGPTLLLTETALSKKMRACWRASNFSGVYVSARGGGLRQLVSSKAIYSESGDAVGNWGEESLRVLLLPTNALPLRESDLDAVAAELQPQLEFFRLRHFGRESRPNNNRGPVEAAASGLTRELFTLLADEAGVEKLLLPIAVQQREAISARRDVDPLAVIVEVIWTPLHDQVVIGMTEVCNRVNALLSSREEKIVYDVREVGWRLTDLGLPRRKTAKGMVLKSSPELRSRIHALARQFGLELPKVHGCQDCVPVQVIE
jgi:hypothetical protein